MESLREVIRKHEKVPMDDPQDRGDLYLLAPMRLLLSPIAEVPELNDVQPSHVTEAPGNDFNKWGYLTLGLFRLFPIFIDIASQALLSLSTMNKLVHCCFASFPVQL